MSDTSTNTPKPAVCGLNSSDGSEVVHYCGVDVPAWMVPKPQPIPKTTLGRLCSDLQALSGSFMSCIFWTVKAVVIRRMAATPMWIMKENWETFWLILGSSVERWRTCSFFWRIRFRAQFRKILLAFVTLGGNSILQLQKIVKRLLHVGIAVLKFLGKFGRNLRHGEPPDVKD